MRSHNITFHNFAASRIEHVLENSKVAGLSKDDSNNFYSCELLTKKID